MSAPDFVVIGHAVRDVVPGGWRLGGTVTFAAVQAHRLGLRVGVVTAAGDDIDVQHELAFAEVVQRRSDASTSFENVYVAGARRQGVTSRADAIPRDAIPDAWLSAPIVLLGPVLDELDPGLAASLSSAGLRGVSAQGWLRGIDAEGRVVHQRWPG
ncbi:MAG TPA: ribokinase, partial [Dehalococcoidia bacterium]|nr:ribokinase [Dehalococcoidia bacterium]